VHTDMIAAKAWQETARHI